MRSLIVGVFVVLTGCATAPGPATPLAGAWPTLSGAAPLVIAHRGASGERPEHTLSAYDLAIAQGADFIEPDLVMTADGVLVCRHDLYLSTTTDVASRPEFADRLRIGVTYDGPREDWWASDFTLAELRSLRAVQPYPGRSPEFDGLETIPTFAEVVALAIRRSEELGRPIGVYPETKSPGHHAAIGLDMVEPLIAALADAGWTGSDAPVFVQSFEPEILQTLNARIDTPLVQLVFPDPDTGRANIPLETLAAFADGVGPNKLLVVDATGTETDFVAQAHALGLAVHPWTVRDDAPPADGADVRTELDRLFALGVDGVFTDFPATAIDVRRDR